MMNQAVHSLLLLLLLLAAGRCDTHNCENKTTHLTSSDLHKLPGSWVLLAALSHGDQQLVDKIFSSHVEFQLLKDNQTIEYVERNIYIGNVSLCTVYRMNLTAKPDSQEFLMQASEVVLEVDGTEQLYNQTAEVEFFLSQNDSDSLRIIYTASQSGKYLLEYRREGSHQDPVHINSAVESLKNLAECLKIPAENPFQYDGTADFCHRKAAVVEKAAES